MHELTASNETHEPQEYGSNHGNTAKTDVFGFKIEKPKRPKFIGDIREYARVKADFKHIIGSKSSDRDAITLLRTALERKPLELIKGTGSDYHGAWEYLDSIYGDPRFVADTVTEEITKFKPTMAGEDLRFCDLVYLINRTYSKLKEVGRPYDRDNNHIMLAIITAHEDARVQN